MKIESILHFRNNITENGRDHFLLEEK